MSFRDENQIYVGLVLAREGDRPALYGLDDITADWSTPDAWLAALTGGGAFPPDGRIELDAPSGLRRVE